MGNQLGYTGNQLGFIYVTKLMPSMEEMLYENRLKELNLYSLEERRVRGDMILMYRLVQGEMDLDYRKFFTDVNECGRWSLRREHPLTLKSKIEESPYMPDVRRHFFTHRVLQPWNNLPEQVVSSENVDAFKRNYDQWRGLIKV